MDDKPKQCSRTGTPFWRCSQMALPGKSICQKHQMQHENRLLKIKLDKKIKDCSKDLKRKREVEELGGGLRRGRSSKGLIENNVSVGEELVLVGDLKIVKQLKKVDELVKDCRGGKKELVSYGELSSKFGEVERKITRNVYAKLGGEGRLATEEKETTKKDHDSKNKEQKRLMCHQCLRSDKTGIIYCSNCKRKRYCHDCITKWYPGKTFEEVRTACPYCRGHCNCKACLDGEIYVGKNWKAGGNVKLQRLLYLLHKVLPLVRQIHSEQNCELEVEAKIQGTQLTEMDIEKCKLDEDDRLYCDNCHTSIVDIHRSCPNVDCSYDLCLTCCRELREGFQPGGNEADSSHQQFIERGNNQDIDENGLSGALRKGSGRQTPVALASNNCMTRSCCQFPDWKANGDGSIPCPPKERGGCGNGLLELRRNFNAHWVLELLNNAEELTQNCQFSDDELSPCCPLCSSSGSSRCDEMSSEVRQAAFRENSHDNLSVLPKLCSPEI
ncbi:hypothetical protein IFM89_029665 [Coptis chinensis]|uniref:Uncharacterized protein n=1 Tax=Coptis chinensis TaxID=261450 RepID=A0A835IEM6_9MAGN|nr:hypothetical protein IFM89_029665 [Coptis chinensis]